MNTKIRPPTNMVVPKARIAMRSGRQSSRSEMPEKKSTAAKNTVERMYLSSVSLAAVPSS